MHIYLYALYSFYYLCTSLLESNKINHVNTIRAFVER